MPKSDLFALAAFFAGGIIAYVYQAAYQAAYRRSPHKLDSGTASQAYEIAILKEIGDRIGYSLDIQEIVDVISGSLHQFIPFSAVSYMLITSEDVFFKMYLERSVNRRFVDDVRDRMLKSLSALLDKEFTESHVREVLTGAILTDDIVDPVRSYFNIPLVIGGKPVGIMTVAHTESGLYKEEEMTILYKIVSQASRAITRLQDVVRTERRKLDAMVESMNDGIIMMDPNYRVLVANPAGRRFLGIADSAEVSIFDLIQKFGERFDVRKKLEESAHGKKVIASDIFFINNTYVQVFIVPVLHTPLVGAEEFLGLAVTLHDATKEIELERMREEFTSMIVHELRSPLSNINKFTELLQDEKRAMDQKTYLDYIHMVNRDSASMLELVNDILDVSKYNAGKFQIDSSVQDIRDVVSERVGFYSLSAKSLGIELHAAFGPVLPPTSFDRKAIERVCNNLISNALKFTKAGGSVTVFAVLHEKGRHLDAELAELHLSPEFSLPPERVDRFGDVLLFGVVDTGEGIAPENLGRLFVKFEQLALPVANKKGTGLGLAISKAIIEAHGGDISAVSRPHEGSMFYCLLPLAAAKKI